MTTFSHHLKAIFKCLILIFLIHDSSNVRIIFLSSHPQFLTSNVAFSPIIVSLSNFTSFLFLHGLFYFSFCCLIISLILTANLDLLKRPQLFIGLSYYGKYVFLLLVYIWICLSLRFFCLMQVPF